MSRFTFAAGNARKIVALPIYGLGALASTVVPRNDRLWVFGSGSGVGEGALALALAARAADASLRIVWLAGTERDRADAAAHGLKAVRKLSWRGFRLTLRAGVIVITHGFGDANRFGVRGGLVVQLWHGIPFKRIHLDSPVTLHVPVLSRFGAARKAMRRVYQRSARGIGMFATASALSAARVRTAFDLPEERIVVTGDPRDDVLSTGTASERRTIARTRLESLLGELPRSSRVILYTPTWRDGERDPAIPDAEDWVRIHEYLERADALLLVRSHPLGAGDYSDGVGERVRMLGSDLQVDITPLLPAVDALVTDYSSIAYDYALVGGELLYLAPDVAEYVASHGLYEPYREFSGGSEVTTWLELIDLLEAGDRDPAVRARLTAHSEWLAERVHMYRDGQNSQRVYERIVNRLAGTATPARGEDQPSGLHVDVIRVVDETVPTVVLEGTIAGDDPTTVALEGSRLRLPGAVSVTAGRWRATIPLLTSRWGSDALPPPSGSYGVRIGGADGRKIDLDVTVDTPAPALHGGLFRLAFSSRRTGISLQFGAPLDDGDRTSQALLRARYRRAGPATENAVFFESYFGQNASCNPRAIDRAIASIRPDVTRYWSVTDASVEVPPGATAVIDGSAEWWRVRASARLLVVNDWLRKRYRRRPGQKVLQTWHGTPLKKLALDRDGVRPRTALATLRERSRWNAMLAQNDFSREIFQSAYAVRVPVWQEGYPRDDILVTGTAAAIRERLGIDAHATVVLYAPTWRDDRPGKVDHLDVRPFTRDLGPDFVTLIRGHSRSMTAGSDVLADGVIDVTGYPDISELFLVADALITDYSSVMFDFTVTGKPIYFFVPDLDHYRDQLRGFYFDLLPVAPGPVLTDARQLANYLRGGGAHVPDFADRYEAWRARFNPLDDGGAAERVVHRLIAEGFLD